VLQAGAVFFVAVILLAVLVLQDYALVVLVTLVTCGGASIAIVNLSSLRVDATPGGSSR
jgi:hypothetical protein